MKKIRNRLTEPSYRRCLPGRQGDMYINTNIILSNFDKTTILNFGKALYIKKYEKNKKITLR